MSDETPTILCLACYYKGGRFLSAAKQAGAKVILVTTEKLADEPWPFESIDEFITLPSVSKQPDITNTIAYLYRTRNIKRLIALDEYDTLTAAQLREHLCLDGPKVTPARRFRDKLTMRKKARESGVDVPDFVGILNYDDVRAFMSRTPAPWMLKPRAEASAMGIRKIEQESVLWETLDALGDKQSHFLLEEFVSGSVHHVDSIIVGGKILFACTSVYREPPLDIYAGGGVFCTQTMPREDPATIDILGRNEQLITAFEKKNGVVHAEFIKRSDTGKYVFLEAAARVGGAGIDQLVEYSSGVNMWEEWARVEVAAALGRTYELPATKQEYAGLIVCLSRMEHPDLSSYSDEEVVFRMNKSFHAGLIVASPSEERVSGLLDKYGERFAADFLATQPPLDSAAEF
ncbi:MAG: ATPase [Rhodothermales bacterium]|nr:ATPase [Rhodothermales bacterium]